MRAAANGYVGGTRGIAHDKRAMPTSSEAGMQAHTSNGAAGSCPGKHQLQLPATAHGSREVKCAVRFARRPCACATDTRGCPIAIAQAGVRSSHTTHTHTNRPPGCWLRDAMRRARSCLPSVAHVHAPAPAAGAHVHCALEEATAARPLPGEAPAALCVGARPLDLLHTLAHLRTRTHADARGRTQAHADAHAPWLERATRWARDRCGGCTAAA
jgi:hypothetical protein